MSESLYAVLTTATPSAEVSNLYYQELLERSADAVEVRPDAGQGKGKGIFAARSYKRGDTLFQEKPVVVIQNNDSKGEALVCNFCMKHTGSVEQQIGHKLLGLVAELSQRAGRKDVPDQLSESGTESDGEEAEVDMDELLAAGERLEQIYSCVPVEQAQALLAGVVQLPMSESIALPPQVACRQGCGVTYCSAACEASAWDQHHVLLCTGPPPQAAHNEPSTAGTSSSAAAGSAGSSSSGASGIDSVHGIHVDRAALKRFNAHAAETNDAFLLAARLVAHVLLAAARLQAAASEGWDSSPQPAGNSAAQTGIASSSRSSSAPNPSIPHPSIVTDSTSNAFSTSRTHSAAAVHILSGHEPAAAGLDAAGRALLAAWLPVWVGWRRVWWESVAVPVDVEDGAAFRQQLRELASESLDLLRAALHAPQYDALMQLPVYGSIMGLFELNNLALAVPSPVEDYFLTVDALPDGTDKQAVQQVTGPLLDALDADYSTPAECNAFLALHSCANHSCEPAAEAAGEVHGAASIMALRDIQAGEEITLSYIDESLPYKERQAALADYGFMCCCARCVREKAARAAKAASKQRAKLTAAMRKR